MLYMLYMLYKQSEIFKSKCSVDSVARAGRGGGEAGTGQAPSVGHHGSGPGSPAESWSKPAAGSGHAARAKPAAHAKAKEAISQGKAAALHLPPGGRSTGPGTACFVRNSQRSKPGVTHPLPSSPAQGGNPSGTPSVTSLSLMVRERRFPAGRCPAVAETGSEHPAPPTRFHANPVQRHQPPSPARFTTATSCDFLT